MYYNVVSIIIDQVMLDKIRCHATF
jgi:hypothetical protein